MQNKRVPDTDFCDGVADVLTTGSNQRTHLVEIRLTTSVTTRITAAVLTASVLNEVEPVTTACGDAESACIQPRLL